MNQSQTKTKSSDTFTCAVDGVSSCSRAPAGDVLVDSRLWQSILGLCERFNTEWMAYLIGVKREDGDYEITKLSFPEQTAGGAHVRNQPSPDFRVETGTVGVIHSHVGMQAFFSSTDKAHANWPVEIVVNRRGEYEVSMRVTLPCGESMRKSSRVLLLTGGQLDAMEATLKEALAKGEEREKRERPAVVWSSRSRYGFMGEGHGAFEAASQHEEVRLLGNKFLVCPICKCKAISCPHSLQEMEKAEGAQRATP